MEQTHTFNQTVTTDQVVHVPVEDRIEALRQAIFRDPAFEEWRKYLAEKRRELSQKVAANEAESRMNDYTEFIEAEYHASRPVQVVSAQRRSCPMCGDTGRILYGIEYHKCRNCDAASSPIINPS